MKNLKKVKINVKKEHINEGQRGKCSLCPVDLAVKEIVKPEFGVRVGYVSIIIEKEPFDDFLSIRHDFSVAAWIVEYDGKNQVAPMSFEIEVPEEILV